MPSPFPGMDPWLENPNHWSGVHLGLIVAIRTQLNRVLPDNLVADIDEYVWVTEEIDSDRELLGRPDVFIPSTESVRTSTRASSRAKTQLVSGSVTVTLPDRKVKKNRLVKIINVEGDRVITVLELLSPSNKKSGSDRDAYMSKRREYFAAGANLIKIDLLRDGDRISMGRPRPPVSDYYVLVSRTEMYPEANVWPFSLRESIPEVTIPLGENIPPVLLDLKDCLDIVYDTGRYQRKLKYGKPPSPPLSRLDAEWAGTILAKSPRKAR